jgi:hypothetical protein
MQIQELIDSTDLDMTKDQVNAFFMGILCSEKPMPFSKALDEILSETPDVRIQLEAPFKSIWDHIQKNLKSELGKIFIEENNTPLFLELAKDQLDFFLTGMSLSGTSIENCSNEALATFIDVLEETVEDLDDFLADPEASDEEGIEFKEFLLETWAEFTSSKQ